MWKQQVASWALSLTMGASAFGGVFSTVVTLQSSANPSTFGQAVTLTATVSSVVGGGTVTFYDGTTVLGLGTATNGQAVFTTSQLPSGTRLLRAYYAGDHYYNPATSPAVKQIVNALPQGGFGAPVSYDLNRNPFFVATSDLNGDGKTDLIVTTSFGTSTSVNILLGKGDGTFTLKVTYGLNSGVLGAFAVAVGDFDGDGKMDLAVANATNFLNLLVMLGNGDGTFRPEVNYVVGDHHTSVVAGDFNGDGKADLVLANYNLTDASRDSVSVLLGNGDGTFKAAVNYNAGRAPTTVSLGDFNGDGNVDLAVPNDGDNNVSILLGNGDGTFQTAVNYSAGTNPQNVAVGDFNGDGNADLAVSNFSSSDVSVLLGKGDGSFKTAVNYRAGNFTYFVTVGDVNGDGKPDLVATSQSNMVSILIGNGDGTFQTAVNYDAGGEPYFIAVGDFNGDGRTDLAVTNTDSSNVGTDRNNVTILLGTPAAPLTGKNSASYVPNVLTADMIAFGEATGIVPALFVPSTNSYPTMLGGAHLDITDSQGQTRAAPLCYVTTTALCFVVPPGTALGTATGRLTTSTGTIVSGGFTIEGVSPGVFTANANGAGVPMGFWTRTGANGAQSYDYLFDPAQPVGNRVPISVDLGVSTDLVFLSFYGTGFRHAIQATATVGSSAVAVTSFAAVAGDQGLDVVNIGPLPQALAGQGQVGIVLSFDNIPANTVTISVR